MEITDRTAHDLIITALEGGIGYWSKVEVLERGTEMDELDYVRTRVLVPFDYIGVDGGGVAGVEGAKIEMIEPSGMARIIGLPAEPYVEVGTITVDTIRAGIAKCEELGGGYMERVAQVATENYDAETADVLVQLGLFGSVVFG